MIGGFVGGPPPTSSAGQVSTGSLSKRRVYPSQVFKGVRSINIKAQQSARSKSINNVTSLAYIYLSLFNLFIP